MVLDGSVYDVVVDIRRGSPTFGRWHGIELSSDNFRQLYVPPGCAHGFCVTSEQAAFLYKCTDFYSPKDERGIIWNDPMLAISWPVSAPVLSLKDQAFPTFQTIQPHLPEYRQLSAGGSCDDGWAILLCLKRETPHGRPAGT